MGRFSREAADPWGLLVAGVVGGVAGVLPGAGLLVGAAVAAAVYGVKVASGVLIGGGGGPVDAPASTRLLRPPDGTAAAFWLGRAERAVLALDEMARGAQISATDVATAHAAAEADVVLDTMRRLGSQAVTVAEALNRADGADLEAEVARLRSAADDTPADSPARRSAEAVADRLAVRNRLRATQQQLSDRLQSSALGLEGLVARVAEVRATAAAVGQVDPSAADLASLTSEVEGLRQGLNDAEQATRQALGPA